MRYIVVANAKGGAGKTTIATHIAAYAAVSGQHTVLIDADPQASALRWCKRRSEHPHPVTGLKGTGKGWRKKLPDNAQTVVIDCPAGAMAEQLDMFLERADMLVVPIQPSLFDVEASVVFLDSLSSHRRVRKGEIRIALVGNRLKPCTRSSQQAMDLLAQWPYPLVAQLRDNQAYVLLTGLGQSLFDYRSQAVMEQQKDWHGLLRWLNQTAAARLA